MAVIFCNYKNWFEFLWLVKNTIQFKAIRNTWIGESIIWYKLLCGHCQGCLHSEKSFLQFNMKSTISLILFLKIFLQKGKLNCAMIATILLFIIMLSFILEI